MADSSQIRSGLSVFLQKKTAARVKNTLFNVMPTLQFIFALAEGGKKGADGLGRPNAGNLAIGRINEVSAPQRERLFREREYLPIIQTTKPSTTEVKAMADYDSEPVVANWDTTNAPMKRFKQPRFKFARFKMPYKIPHSEVRTAISSATTEGQAAKAVGSVYDVEVKTRLAVLCEKLNADLFTSAGAPTDEDAVTWDKFHSLKSALSATNTYGGIDRSLAANSWWRGNTVSSAFSGTFEGMIEHCNYDLGMIAKGLGVQLITVGKTLMKKAKAEAKSESYQLLSNGIPEYPEFGFKREIVRIYSGSRPVYIAYDPEIDVLDTAVGTNHAFALDPSTWSVAFHPDKNFKVSTPSDQTKVEGGDEADTGTIEVELMLACEVPSSNAVFVNVS